MYKAIIEAHNLREIDTEPVELVKIERENLFDLTVAVCNMLGTCYYRWIPLLQDNSINISISEVKE